MYFYNRPAVSSVVSGISHAQHSGANTWEGVKDIWHLHCLTNHSHTTNSNNSPKNEHSGFYKRPMPGNAQREAQGGEQVPVPPGRGLKLLWCGVLSEDGGAVLYSSV